MQQVSLDPQLCTARLLLLLLSTCCVHTQDGLKELLGGGGGWGRGKVSYKLCYTKKEHGYWFSSLYGVLLYHMTLDKTLVELHNVYKIHPAGPIATLIGRTLRKLCMSMSEFISISCCSAIGHVHYSLPTTTVTTRILYNHVYTLYTFSLVKCWSWPATRYGCFRRQRVMPMERIASDMYISAYH